MNIFINGESFSLQPSQASNALLTHALQVFLSDVQLQTTYAVAVNSEFVGRDVYDSTSINQGDSIDVLFPIQGG